jgi:hypothetical protein
MLLHMIVAATNVGLSHHRTSLRAPSTYGVKRNTTQTADYSHSPLDSSQNYYTGVANVDCSDLQPTVQ